MILATHPSPLAPDAHTTYAMHPSGRAVLPVQFRKLADRLEAVGDGLFAGMSQTWRLRADG